MKSLFITAAIFLGMCLIYILIMLSKTENYFTYILDDAYIHLAMAKNFALHGVWGMTKYSFSSSSSSPIFTAILSVLILVFGNNEIIPLIFNIAVSFLIIFFLNKYYASFFDKNKYIVFASLFTMLFSVMHLQIFTGMEHSLQVLIVVVNIFCLQKWIRSEFKDQFSLYWFYLTILLLGLVRFESMFYFVSLAFVFFLIKKYKEVVLTLILGFGPILIFGYFNYQQAGSFFPNSVVVKGTQFDLSDNYFLQIKSIILSKIILNITFYKVGLLPLLMAVILIFKDYRNGLSSKKVLSNNLLLIAWSLTLILHGLFGNFRGFFRYEAYILIAFSMIIIPRISFLFSPNLKIVKENKAIIGIVVLNIVLLIYKLGYSHLMIVNGSANIYEQQLQSASFLKKYYNTSKVVANDIGAVCYFTEIHLLDIAGLGSKEMVPFNEQGKTFNNKFEKFLIEYCDKNQFTMAIVYEEWFNGHIPKNWKKVAVLKIDKSTNTAIDHVFIYSIDPKIYESLKQNVKDFKWNKNVDVKIIE